MDFDGALRELADDNPVWRKAWPKGVFLETQFEAEGEYTMKDSRGLKVSFDAVQWTKDGLGDDTLSEEDKAATDWATV